MKNNPAESKNLFPDEKLCRLIVENITDGVYVLDRNRIIRYWNRGAEALTGYTASEVIGKSCADNILMHVDEKGKNLCLGACPVSKAMEENSPKTASVFLKHKKGHRIPVLVKVTPLIDSEGEVIGAVETFSDNTAQYYLSENVKRIKRLALLDPLTEIANRRLLETFIQAKIEEVLRYSQDHALFFIDIDDFKNINDKYGHETGDLALKMVARTLIRALRPFDLVGRWGGEEFIVVASNLNPRKCEGLAERLRVLVEQSQFSSSKGPVKVTISIGATMIRPDDTVNSLVERADSLMYKSKAKGKNCVTCG
ncbi:MAG: diguanylate cyclase [Deltaproteobacteria bacterium]|nr:diguanylate cyclase [Deltaproteobacteria bacterium]